ncbi:MAG: hypothetical protein L0191_15740, partial [Acidobacteria bacterium]|nr:hypothetical protein [Acidobacteriota bacterium]
RAGREHRGTQGGESREDLRFEISDLKEKRACGRPGASRRARMDTDKARMDGKSKDYRRGAEHAEEE